MSTYVDLSSGAKINAIKELGNKIENLDKNIQVQSKIETKLTIAMYILSGVAVLLMVVQILIAKNSI